MTNEAVRGQLRYIVNIGGFGSGKTYGGAVCAWLLALSRPHSRGLISSVSYRQLEDTSMVEFEQAGESFGFYSKVLRYSKSEKKLYFKNGATIIFRSTEIGRKLLSLNLHWFWLDQAESVRREHFRYLQTRIRKPYTPQVVDKIGNVSNMGIMTANPNPSGWFDSWAKKFIPPQGLWEGKFNKKTKAWEFGEKKSRGLLMRTSTRENIHLEPSYIADLIEQFGGPNSPLAQRLIDGLDCPMGGLIYSMFREDKHVVAPFPIPRHWEKWAAIDFGYVNPFVYLMFAKDPERDRQYIIAEHYMRGQEMSFHSRAIRKIERALPYDIGVGREKILRFADHDRQDQAELAKEEIYTTNARKDVIPGIYHVIKRLSKVVEGRPGLQIFSTCVNTIREIAEYCWDEKAVGDAPLKAKAGNLDEGEPYGDHAMDTIRYGTYSKEHLAGPLSEVAGRRPRGPFHAR
jgi:hypothetical protein